GERITQQSRAVLDFLLMLCSIGQHYPGFETDIHGAKRNEDGVPVRSILPLWPFTM
ncbi:hypothetical protein MJM04_35295, partial [Salmonella enterica subsp. enterica serovar Cerro]|nr:hypothetical protein [Salmonella enterica subsp. enterica serovar Cerro]